MGQTASSAAIEPTLAIRDVSKIYRMGDVDVPVLHHVNLDILPGELVVIVGPSGSGKSTLLNLIGGIDTPTSGTIHFHNQEISRFSERQLTAYRRRQIGFVFQFYNLIPTLTAAENVRVATEISTTPLQVEESLAWVKLTHRAEHFPSQMSGGEQQRVAIARAIAKNPELLLCDEPTGALDLDTGRMILGVLARLQKELRKTVIIITHNSAIAHMADRIIHIGSGTIAEIQQNPNPTPPEQISW